MNFQTTYQGGQLDRALQKSLPCLPGYTFNLNVSFRMQIYLSTLLNVVVLQVGADRFNKPGHWGFNKDIRILSEVEGYRPRAGIGADTPEPRPRPGIGGILPPPWAPVRTGPDHSVFPRQHGVSCMPTWLEFDKKVNNCINIIGEYVSFTTTVKLLGFDF